jgi:hypothetical protein
MVTFPVSVTLLSEYRAFYPVFPGNHKFTISVNRSLEMVRNAFSMPCRLPEAKNCIRGYLGLVMNARTEKCGVFVVRFPKLDSVLEPKQCKWRRSEETALHA